MISRILELLPRVLANVATSQETQELKNLEVRYFKIIGVKTHEDYLRETLNLMWASAPVRNSFFEDGTKNLKAAGLSNIVSSSRTKDAHDIIEKWSDDPRDPEKFFSDLLFKFVVLRDAANSVEAVAACTK